MSDKPAAYQLGIYISIVFIIVFGLFTYWSFNYKKELIRKNAESTAKSISTSIIGAVNGKLTTAQELTITLSEQLIYHHSKNDFLLILENLLSRHEHITSFQVTAYYSDNPKVPNFYFSEKLHEGFYSQFSNQQEIICYEVEKVLTPMRSANLPGWSIPFSCPRQNQLAVIYYYPFQFEYKNSNRSVNGYISCEVSLDFLNRMILGTKVGKEGFAFLISSDGTFLTHPVQEYILNQNLFNLPRQFYRGSLEELHRFVNDDFGSVIVYPDPLQNKKCISFHSKIETTGWILATVYPYRELFKELYWLLAKMIVLTILFVTTIFLSIFYISKRVMRPLSEVTHQIHRFSSDSHEYDFEIKNEADALLHSLKRLRKTYEKFRMNEAESLEKSKKLQSEMQTASEIQRSIIPPQGLWNLNGNGISLFSVFRPANMVSGDLYDFFMVDEKHLLITIGDVSGSGVPAALFMGVAHTFIKSYAKGNSAKTIVENVNSVLCRNNSNQFFLTLFLGILNIDDGTFNYCNAGHAPVYHIPGNGKMNVLNATHGLPLGLFSERIYEESTLLLHYGDKLIMFTDGITDQTNDAGKHFGETQLRDLVGYLKSGSPQEIAENIITHVKKFSENQNHPDDLSLIVFQYDNQDKERIATYLNK